MTDPAPGPALALCGSNLSGDAAFSCALRTAAGVFTVRSPAGTRGDLAQLTAELCKQHGVPSDQVQELRIDLGPGSYTGLRVAVTFARFLQRFGNIPVLACDSLMLLASAHAPTPTPGRLRPLLDARRDRFHCAAVVHDAAGLRHVVEPSAQPLESVLQSFAAGDRILVSPALAERFATAAAARGAIVEAMRDVDARHLFSAGLPLQRCEPAQMEPRYLMGSYAE